jgi:hypothetical protein
VTKTEFAAKAGVSQPAISIALKAGRIHADPDGSMNPRRAENANYLSTAKRQRRQAGRSAGGETKHPPAKRQVRGHRGRRKSTKSDDDEGSGGSPAEPLRIDGETYGEAELRKIIAQADKEEQNNAIRRGELVERADVKLVFARVYTIITSQIKTMSEKLGPDIAAALGVTEEHIPRVQELMSIDVLRALAQIKKDFNAFLDSVGEQVIE